MGQKKEKSGTMSPEKKRHCVSAKKAFIKMSFAGLPAAQPLLYLTKQWDKKKEKSGTMSPEKKRHCVSAKKTFIKMSFAGLLQVRILSKSDLRGSRK
ncbi:MAG: hypothetical protein LBH61_05240 [Dysgonamonadaceae bacterium]|jgi:hypothetical protein|nr:hypothetical protein [Dysgonamonadaceae bacterium]